MWEVAVWGQLVPSLILLCLCTWQIFLNCIFKIRLTKTTQLENAHRPFQLILYFIQNNFHQKKEVLCGFLSWIKNIFKLARLSFDFVNYVKFLIKHSLKVTKAIGSILSHNGQWRNSSSFCRNFDEMILHGKWPCTVPAGLVLFRVSLTISFLIWYIILDSG